MSDPYEQFEELLNLKSQNENVEIFSIDDEGILFRAYANEDYFFYLGDPEDPESPLLEALHNHYLEHAPYTLLCEGYRTPYGALYWSSEMATPFGDDHTVDVGERIFLIDDTGRRFADEFVYNMLSQEKIPEGWVAIPRHQV